MNITVLSGSPRAESTSYNVARNLENYLGSNYPSHNIHFIDVRNHPVPPMQDVWSSVEKTPAEHQAMAEILFNSDAIVLVTPEYNGSYSPAMKNLLDHFPKQDRKVFGIVTSSTGGMGGMRAAQQMQQLVCALFGVPSPYMLLVPNVQAKFNTEGALIDPAFEKNIETFVKQFVWLAEAVSDKKKQ